MAETVVWRCWMTPGQVLDPGPGGRRRRIACIDARDHVSSASSVIVAWPRRIVASYACSQAQRCPSSRVARPIPIRSTRVAIGSRVPHGRPCGRREASTKRDHVVRRPPAGLSTISRPSAGRRRHAPGRRRRRACPPARRPAQRVVAPARRRGPRQGAVRIGVGRHQRPAAAAATTASLPLACDSRSSMCAADSGSASRMNSSVGVWRMPSCVPTSARIRPLALSCRGGGPARAPRHRGRCRRSWRAGCPSDAYVGHRDEAQPSVLDPSLRTSRPR